MEIYPAFSERFFNQEINWQTHGITYSTKNQCIEVADEGQIEELAIKYFDSIVQNPDVQQSIRSRSLEQKKIFHANLVHLAQTTSNISIKIKIYTLDRFFSNSYDDLDEIGNKAKNCVILDDLLVKEKMPSFCTLKHSEIKNFLLSQGYDLDAAWADFVLLQGSSETLLPTAAQKLEEIRTEVKRIFEDHIFTSAQLDGLLELLSENDVVMVRSTGREDSQKAANAGGNETLPSKPNLADISKVIGQVIASYIDEKSLAQRLLNHEDILEKPYLPVMVQKMVGERIRFGELPEQNKQKIPVSFVLYTSEAEGNANGVVHIQASYGHGEGVVNSTVNLDSYYLYDDDTRHEVISPKHERMICIEEVVEGKVKLNIQATPNPPDIIKSPCLDQKALKALKQAAELIENYYQMPMDVEGVYLPEKDTVYIVQARPLVSKKNVEPTYTEIPKQQRHEIKGRLIGEGTGEVKIIKSKDNIIVAETLDAALRHYLKPDTNRKAVQAVIVRQMAGSTSHAATTFRGEKMPVLAIENLEKVEDLIHNNEPFLVDIQRTALFELSPIIPNAQNMEVAQLNDALRAMQMLCMGRISYPLPLEQTLTMPRWDQLQQNLNEYIQKVEQSPLWQEISDKSLNERVALLSERSELDKAEVALASISKDLFKAVKKYGNEEVAALPLLNALVAMKEAQNAISVYQSLTQEEKNNEVGEQLYKRVLIAKKWLETALIQESSRFVIGSESFNQYLAEIKAEKKIESIWNRVPNLARSKDSILMTEREAKEFFIQYAKVGKTALRPELASAWESFVLTIAKSRSMQDNQRLARLLKIMQEKNVMPEFMQLVFETQWKKSQGDAVECLNRLEQEISHALSYLEGMPPIHKLMNKWERKISDWSQTAKFDNNWKQFVNDIPGVIQNPDWMTLLQNPDCPPFAKSILLKSIERLTNVYDKSIKSFKGSCEHTPENIKRFGIMLEPYHELMRKMVCLIPSKVYESWINKTIVDQKSSQRDRMLESISTSFVKCKESRNPVQFLPQNFSVANAKIGSGANFSRGFIQKEQTMTLENLFSLMHQNILESISVLQHENGLRIEQLPDYVQALTKDLMKPYEQIGTNIIGYQVYEKKETFTPNILSIDVSEFPKVKVPINIPLRNHSSNIQITYDALTKVSELKIELLGEARNDRLYTLCVAALFAGMANDLNIKTLPNGDIMSASIGWEWSERNQNQEALVRHLVEAMLLGTFENDRMTFDTFEKKFLTPITKQHLKEKLSEMGPKLWSVLNAHNSTNPGGVNIRDRLFGHQSPEENYFELFDPFDFIENVPEYSEKFLEARSQEIAQLLYQRMTDGTLPAEKGFAIFKRMCSGEKTPIFDYMMSDPTIPEEWKWKFANQIIDIPKNKPITDSLKSLILNGLHNGSNGDQLALFIAKLQSKNIPLNYVMTDEIMEEYVRTRGSELTTLILSALPSENFLAKALTCCPNLRGLKLIEININDKDVETFVNGPITQLEFLSFEGCDLNSDKIRKLFQSDLRKLQTLEIEYCDLNSETMNWICESDLTNLHDLNLSGSCQDPETIQQLVNAKSFSNLASLNMKRNKLGKEGVEQLLKANFIENLKYLNLDTNKINLVGIKLLSSTEKLKKLEELSLLNNGVRDISMTYLARAKLPNLKTLRVNTSTLNDFSLTSIGIIKLLESKTMTSLEHIVCDNMAELMAHPMYHKLKRAP